MGARQGDAGRLMTTTGIGAPPLRDLAGAAAEAERWLARAAAARTGGWHNAQGGDVGGGGTSRGLLRHVANYLAAVELVEAGAAPGPMLDVGSGVGGLAAWAADRLGRPLHLVDHDPALRAVAASAFAGVTVHADLAQVAPGAAGVVTAMEVVEHVPHAEQPAFVRQLWERVAGGGLLVVSTPDETRYLGGSSGYAPHVGCVSADELRDILARATDGLPAVWRLEGAPFALSPLMAVVQPVANRAWGVAGRLLGPVVGRVAAPAVTLARRLPGVAASPVKPQVRAVAPGAGTGTGLLAVVRRD